jgi:hypothetical protein
MALPAAARADLQARHTKAAADLAVAQSNGNSTVQALANEQRKEFERLANVNGDAPVT